eukprot:TRINITY_DN3101_c0_g1_i1.p1 TRINITY_DN3101_c0_g1~~TRINITY_DN3101_c0_g1_i1.p1  ORF type:complete len:177 (+),score=33.41 TRINITY_DN3101_c0_g1_i1:44-574(+)
MKLGVAVLVFALFGFASSALVRTDWAMIAHGNCHNGRECSVRANSQEIKVFINPQDGVETSVHETKGSYAEFNFEVTKANSTNFFDKGNVTFGTHLVKNHVAFFQPEGPGDISKGPDPTHDIFAALYSVKGGAGFFEKAYGTFSITGEINTSSNDVVMSVVGIIYSQPAHAAVLSQ